MYKKLKRGMWYVFDEDNPYVKFNTEEEADEYMNYTKKPQQVFISEVLDLALDGEEWEL